MIEEKKSWARQSEKHYPIGQEQIDFLVDAAHIALPTNLFLTSHVPAEKIPALERQYNELRGKTLSVEGMFGGLPSVRKQKGLSETDIRWFAQVAAYYAAVVEAIPVGDGKDMAAVSYISKLHTRASGMTMILDAIQQPQITV